MKHEEITELFNTYLRALKEAGSVSGAVVADQLGGFCDTLTDLAPGEDDGLSREEWLKEIGLCPDDTSHFKDACYRLRCPRYAQELADENPWIPVAELGRYL